MYRTWCRQRKRAVTSPVDCSSYEETVASSCNTCSKPFNAPNISSFQDSLLSPYHDKQFVIMNSWQMNLSLPYFYKTASTCNSLSCYLLAHALNKQESLGGRGEEGGWTLVPPIPYKFCFFHFFPMNTFCFSPKFFVKDPVGVEKSLVSSN